MSGGIAGWLVSVKKRNNLACQESDALSITWFLFGASCPSILTTVLFSASRHASACGFDDVSTTLTAASDGTAAAPSSPPSVVPVGSATASCAAGAGPDSDGADGVRSGIIVTSSSGKARRKQRSSSCFLSAST